ncbi:HAMP domain-containing sensor histidine kinase [Candidatus Nitronereus thalassa]|uniref:histidine kinase n=1 Tax=Candidatus Nitronereus thalassa TaxID=3020898 RepID=A0ABU3K6A4_9BACT|nr:HAMP domain-containing sensor histidine kinase [Candidatus Nitronereus thalassa]MDT7041959.1 HAMP domain-containing sensor histidine kinase [Candidatus Nitronereus thalassa]
MLRVWNQIAKLSIFVRLTLGYLTIMTLVIGVNWFILSQLRTLSELGTELVSYHYPTVETAKRLITSLLVQLKSDKQYLVLRDTSLLKEFLQEAGQFKKTLISLVEQDPSKEGQALLQQIQLAHDQFQTLFLSEGVERGGRFTKNLAQYERNRDALIDSMTASTQSYIALHEQQISTVLSDSHKRAKQAENITRQLMVTGVLFGMGLAGIATFSILRPLRRVQRQIREIGRGDFSASVQGEVPQELRELVGTVNWMGTQLQELDQMKTEFLANISHELRTPLTSIREGTQLLLDQVPGPLTPEQHQTLSILLDSTQRLNQLIATLLDLSKMEANMMAYSFTPTLLTQLVQQTVDKVQFLAERKQISLSIDNQLPPNHSLSLDSIRIEQALENLLSNALKFSPNGSPILVTLRHESASHLTAISVQDKGPGIPPEDLPHIFERFYQGRTPDGGARFGSGIGLALAKKVVEAHQGEIWIDSALGKGTIVQITLPAETVEEKVHAS